MRRRRRRKVASNPRWARCDRMVACRTDCQGRMAREKKGKRGRENEDRERGFLKGRGRKDTSV